MFIFITPEEFTVHVNGTDDRISDLKYTLTNGLHDTYHQYSFVSHLISALLYKAKARDQTIIHLSAIKNCS